MFGKYVALFDASVLYPAPVRDLLIELATKDVYRAMWTNAIHDEWVENLLRKRPDLKRKNIERTRALINESVEDCLVDNYELFIEALELPDPGDRHVLAAAIKGQAQGIVTYNVKDFPSKTLSKFGLEVQHPDDFFLNQMDLNRPIFLRAVKSIRAALTKPLKSQKEYLDTLRKHALVKTAESLSRYSFLI